MNPGLGPSICARFWRSDLAGPCPAGSSGGFPERGAASETGGWGAELGVTEWADSGARSSTSDPLGQGNPEQALAGSLGTQGFRSSSKLPGERKRWKWRSGMGMEVGGKGTGRRKSLFPRSPSRPRGWVAGPPLQPTGAENVPGTGHQAPRRIPSTPGSALLPTCPPPRPATETHSPQELDLVLAAFSPFGHGSRDVGAAPASGASASPAAALRALVAAALFSSSSSSRAPGSAQQRRANPRPYIGSWANTPLHCRAPAPTEQPAYPSHLSPQPSALRPWAP